MSPNGRATIQIRVICGAASRVMTDNGCACMIRVSGKPLQRGCGLLPDGGRPSRGCDVVAFRAATEPGWEARSNPQRPGGSHARWVREGIDDRGGETVGATQTDDHTGARANVRPPAAASA